MNRYFGPVDTDNEALNIADSVLDHPETLATFAKFAKGNIDAEQLSYQLQVIMENVEAKLRGNND